MDLKFKSYETVFIMTPVLSDEQVKQTIDKYVKLIEENKGQIVHQYKQKLRKLAYPIQKKNTGIYQIIEFKAQPSIIDIIEREYKLDDNIMRFITVSLDKHAIEYNSQKRKADKEKEKEKEDKISETKNLENKESNNEKTDSKENKEEKTKPSKSKEKSSESV